MSLIAIVIVLLLLAVAVAAIALAPPGRGAVRARRHGATGLPPGRVVYSDADGTARPLAARRYPLTGKPDYVVLTPGGLYVPVEVKSARVRGAPRHEDVLQLAAYMIILEDLYEPAPRFGVLSYANTTFEVPYTAELRAEVLALLNEMRALDGVDPLHGEAPPGNPSAARCRSCAFRAICPDAALPVDMPLCVSTIIER